MRIVHVVLIRWAAQTSDEHRERARAVARGLKERIGGVESIVEGPSVSPEGLEQGYDYGLIVTFTDAAARDAYLPHPAHLELSELFGDGAIDGVTVLDLQEAAGKPLLPQRNDTVDSPDP